MSALATYCMIVSCLGFFFILYLAVLMSMDSETMYVKPIEPATKDDALVALYVGAFLYAVCFAASYYFKYYARVDRAGLQQFINKARANESNQIEMVQKY